MATRANEPIALKATVEPMLMRERRQVMVKVRRTALSGIFQPGLIYSLCQQHPSHSPVNTYVGNEAGERQAVIASERPSLSRDCGNCADTSRCDVDDDDSRHDGSPNVTVCRIGEDLNEWIASGRFNDCQDVA